jgi:hypothetical protein
MLYHALVPCPTMPYHALSYPTVSCRAAQPLDLQAHIIEAPTQSFAKAQELELTRSVAA